MTMRGLQRNKNKIIELLEPYLKLGLSINKACQYCEIPQTTIHTWISKDEELRTKIASWRNYPSLQARIQIVKRIQEGDIKASMWWLDKTGDFRENIPNNISIEIVNAR